MLSVRRDSGRAIRRCGPGDSVDVRWMPSPLTTMRPWLRPSLPLPLLVPTRRSSTQPTVAPHTTRPCGSCARRAGRCPSTERYAVRVRSSMRSSSPNSPPRSRCSPSVATASTQRCSTATSSLRRTPSGSASTSRPGTGPVAERPFRSSNDLERLRPLDFDDISYVIDTVDLLVAELDVPLLAFAGAPFTVASYLIEGRPSKDYRHTKALIHTDEVALARGDGTPGRVGDHVHRRAAVATAPPPSNCSTRGPGR